MTRYRYLYLKIIGITEYLINIIYPGFNLLYLHAANLKKNYLKLQVQPWQNTSTIEDFQEKFNKFYNDPRHSNIRTITPNDMIIDKYYAGKYQLFLIIFFFA